MITRIVKMVLQEGESQVFENIFGRVRGEILSFEGCVKVELLKDQAHPSVYFTISHWNSAYALENYRSSDIFKQTWKRVKPLFAQKAEAWSLQEVSLPE